MYGGRELNGHDGERTVACLVWGGGWGGWCLCRLRASVCVCIFSKIEVKAGHDTSGDKKKEVWVGGVSRGAQSR